MSDYTAPALDILRAAVGVTVSVAAAFVPAVLLIAQ